MSEFFTAMSFNGYLMLTAIVAFVCLGTMAFVLGFSPLAFIPFMIAGAMAMALVTEHWAKMEAAKPPVAQQITANRIMVDPASGCRYLREGLTGLVQMLRADGLPDCRQP